MIRACLIFCIFSSVSFGDAATPADQAAQSKKENAVLDKTPRSVFLVKRAKINVDVGGPQFYPAEAQLRTVIDDPAIHNIKKFE